MQKNILSIVLSLSIFMGTLPALADSARLTPQDKKELAELNAKESQNRLLLSKINSAQASLQLAQVACNPSCPASTFTNTLEELNRIGSLAVGGGLLFRFFVEYRMYEEKFFSFKSNTIKVVAAGAALVLTTATLMAATSKSDQERSQINQAQIIRLQKNLNDLQAQASQLNDQIEFLKEALSAKLSADDLKLLNN
jgi:hypothetical protein